MRIISLVPSLTELLLDLGLSDQLVGRTRFCVRPEDKVDDIPIIGGTKNPRIDKILDAEPDLIIANQEENRKEDIDELQKMCEVMVTDIRTIEDALLAIYELGKRLDVQQKAQQMIERINQLYEDRPNEPPLQTAYFIWRNPWMSVGNDTYIHDVMQQWNLTNIFGFKKRYPIIKMEDVHNFNPELILLSTEPYPFKEKHITEVEDYCPDTRILQVDGQWFSWYGTAMLRSFEQLNIWRKAIA